MPDQAKSTGDSRAWAREERLRLILASARAVFARSGHGAFSDILINGTAGVKARSVRADFPSDLSLFRASIADRMDGFVSAMAISVQAEDVQRCLECILFNCALLGLDADLVAIGRRVVTSRDQFPEFARVFYRECIERLPVALALWLDMQKQHGVLDLDCPAAAAEMLVGMMTSELRFAGLFEWQAVASVDQFRDRARQCATLFLHGCRSGASDAERRVEHAPC